MREIKFRAWDKDNKEMLEVENLYFNEMNGQVEIKTRIYSDYFNEEEMVLMQYTGLKDKNGKEIYEGDIVQYIYYKYSNDDFGHKGFYRRLLEIYYDETNMRFDYKFIKTKEIEMPKDYKEPYMEVIGNIYENPDLLKEE